MKDPELSGLFSLLKEKTQKNLVLVTAYFLQKILKGESFSAKDIKSELVGRVRGASRINVGAVFLMQCTGLIEPLKRNSADGLKLWRLTDIGLDFVSAVLTNSESKDAVKRKNTLSLCFDDLHPVIQQASMKLFQDGHLSGAVEAAFKAVNRHLRQKTGRTSDGGVAMMHKVFSPAEFKEHNDCLRLNLLVSQSDKDEQEGYRFLFAGAQQGIRNPFDHDGRLVDSPVATLEYLAFASHLARIIDKAQQV